jgi:ribosomal-protein-alanine N-acetyltransferase
MPGTVFLEGEKINLRTVEEEDADFLQSGVNHPKVRVWMSNTRPQNLEDEKEFIEEIVSDDDSINLLICRDGNSKGIISLNDKDDEGKVGELGIWLHPDFHENGFGTEAAELLTNHAFNQLNYHKICARAQKQNQPSIRIWEKLGFEKEGEFREHTYAQGEYQNVVYLGVLQGEWQ